MTYSNAVKFCATSSFLFFEYILQNDKNKKLQFVAKKIKNRNLTSPEQPTTI